ncbi:hypothetical protein TGPRC2_307575 [Toxoplasma gondii TgCatPRC2]|uniref:Uncharacterized protein n=14 Tax=Toxoplasma gondii TaxID=5811 RepID=A0A125YHB3_TOXGV|nr:hypothetical protein TGME49_307575 [Toxoplasma gondii ME49]EPR56916.1 hypothetical protein TGGT1_307575 [Toxoplasma gondii GT1]ESS29104.1 hypothetical protein TGVEG_307575 [Toxoplasma gondii VEG]KAF4644671.1 hypothetical protein TGRH88_016650 [Toxoplasma gondii]KFG27834.1 hypothetical protein TGP89_307575 [Toxoplasma gondii p89]KFG29453.1 hypothetical protein TGDOM2_307575 [Toxoplasma gondii GAB2-2007-GAL-DOM2]KFG32022.1 hypothetical protein TGFOU_307575 [Toxoplasma gondii FOU]KFG59196.1 |eukprot:XP_018636194.1 hypothetical protein TGME49_307575 [Toxoplasma gondii ME49]
MGRSRQRTAVFRLAFSLDGQGGRNRGRGRRIISPAAPVPGDVQNLHDPPHLQRDGVVSIPPAFVRARDESLAAYGGVEMRSFHHLAFLRKRIIYIGRNLSIFTYRRSLVGCIFPPSFATRQSSVSRTTTVDTVLAH